MEQRIIKIDLGGAINKPVGYTSVDINPKADIVCDLERSELPFQNNEVNELRASHTLEHIENLIPLMNECWRILKKDGTFWIAVPKFPHTDAVRDPTHKRFFVKESFDYFTEKYSYLDYGIKLWKILSLQEKENEIICILQPVNDI